jgi:hypothetical protein
MSKKKHEWELIEWDGSLEVEYKCWRKKFGRGCVYVGAGDLLTVVFSYGPNSDDSYSSTRWDYDRPVITEEEAMKMVDAGKGKAMVGRMERPIGWLTQVATNTISTERVKCAYSAEKACENQNHENLHTENNI